MRRVKVALNGYSTGRELLEVPEVYFTSDTHFNHVNIIKYSSRPFTDTEHMNAEIIKSWNAAVGKDDLVFHLGDFAMGQKALHKGFLEALNGRIILIPGNHDSYQTVKLFEERHKFVALPRLSVTVDKQTAVLSHYSMRLWDRSHKGHWHLYGHSHGTVEDHGMSFDVGMDPQYLNHGVYFRPLTWGEVCSRMRDRKVAILDHHNKDTNP